jgi:peptidylprolyl isomerase
VNDIKRLHHPLLLSLGLLLSAAIIAGCGSSESSSIAVGQENPNAGKEAAKYETSTSTSSAPTAPTASTPKTGPLSKEPKVPTPSGPPPTSLVKKEIIKGTGAEAVAGDTVSVNYVGADYKSGKVFDASWKRNEPFSFTLGKGQVIKGWDEGVAGMKVGGRRELIIPPSLGYGAAGKPPSIPPNETLIFVVDLLQV